MYREGERKVEESFIAFVADIMDIDVTKINLDTTYGAIDNWDSLMHMRLVLEIESEYQIEIPINEIPKINSLRDFYKYIQI